MRFLLPGFNGAARQPILLKFERLLRGLGLSCARKALSKGRPSPGLLREVGELASFIAPGPLVGAVVLLDRSIHFGVERF